CVITGVYLELVCVLSMLFFLFQAEDGIRDKLVTGVQTCALPISIAAAGCGSTSRSTRSPRRWPTRCGRCSTRKGETMTAMPQARTAAPLLVLSLLAPAAACHRHAPESRVKSVEARIDGITCPTCVPPLTASLTRPYQQSAVEVSDEKDTATIQFADNENFSPAEFRAAVERVRMHVIRVRMQACGTVQTADGKTGLTE